jgi:lipopolysaccharide/colanic/teichoic acid biosynthesis glycosyltransferase
MQSLSKRKIAYIKNDSFNTDDFLNRISDLTEIHVFNDCDSLIWKMNDGLELSSIIATGSMNTSTSLTELKKVKACLRSNIPIILIVERINHALRKEVVAFGIAELFTPSVNMESFVLRMDYIIAKSLEVAKIKKENIALIQQYKISPAKRIFDIFFSLIVLILLSPLFLIIALLIRIESRGPVFYSSKRVGTGYKIFDFYKFRSMSQGADKKIKDLSNLNQYKKERSDDSAELSGLCNECTVRKVPCQSMLYQDGETICEKMHKRIKKDLNGATFIKFKGDPRVTKIGQFIRNTSIDELPQLFNVLKGDMSVVGNRPLPLYEAEKVTTDRFITRFMAPAGITGLWQVSKRGKGKMSEEERIELDNVYANKHSFWGDIKIILKTIPALLQKENV